MGDTDIRSALESAYDELDTTPEETPAETPVPAAEAAPAEAPAEAPQDAAGEDVQGETPQEKSARARDEAGRFAKEAKEKKAAAAAAGKAEPAPAKGSPPAPGAKDGKAAAAVPPVPKPPPLDAPKAPQSWRATEREAWAKVPPSAQAAIARRETEFAQAMAEAAPAKQLAKQFQATVAPFVPFIRAGGGDVLATVGSLLQTQHVLFNGPVADRAAIIANIMTSGGIPGELVAAALEGKAAPQQAPQVHPQQLIAQAKEEVMRELQTQRASALESRYDAHLDSFAETHEFADRLWGRMEKLVASGLANDLEEAYTQAAQLDPDVRGYLQQRDEAKRANAEAASTQRARVAASSLRSQPLPAPAGEAPAGLRDVLEATWDRLSGSSR